MGLCSPSYAALSMAILELQAGARLSDALHNLDWHLRYSSGWCGGNILMIGMMLSCSKEGPTRAMTTLAFTKRYDMACRFFSHAVNLVNCETWERYITQMFEITDCLKLPLIASEMALHAEQHFSTYQPPGG